MIIEHDWDLSEAQEITTSAASEEKIDQTAAGDSMCKELWFTCRIDTTFTGGTSLTIALQTDDNDSFSSPTTLASSGVILTAALLENTIVFQIKLPPGAERYIRVYYTVDGTYGAGKIDAFFSSDVLRQ
jgi:hypothetical protein